MTATLLQPWTDGTVYQNYVMDDKTHKLRPITEVENDIVDWCFSKGNRTANEACKNIGYCKFEMEPFSSDELLEAAEYINGIEFFDKGYKSKLTKHLLEVLDDYIREKKGV